ncbi:MAG: hypothetical protein JWN51_973 [Phycisphaerales bacterium]|nr:hypothetical protein [Phycisphaerales bacterium]
MPTKPETADEYVASLPPDRRTAIQAVREVVLKNLDKGYAEGIQYGMIGYYVPHSLYPPGYHCDPKLPLNMSGLASQKNHMALYLMCVYGNSKLETWLKKEWAKTGKKLDMGKACIRFKKLEDLPLELIGRLIARVTVKDFVAGYEAALAGRRGKKT